MKHLTRKIDRQNWQAVAGDIAEQGFARTGKLLTAAECGSLAGLFGDNDRFRSTVDMARHRYGEGAYRYFADPLMFTVVSGNASRKIEACSPIHDSCAARLRHLKSAPALQRLQPKPLHQRCPGRTGFSTRRQRPRCKAG